jgi:hypothetical protein
MPKTKPWFIASNVIKFQTSSGEREQFCKNDLPVALLDKFKTGLFKLM